MIQKFEVNDDELDMVVGGAINCLNDYVGEKVYFGTANDATPVTLISVKYASCWAILGFGSSHATVYVTPGTRAYADMVTRIERGWKITNLSEPNQTGTRYPMGFFDISFGGSCSNFFCASELK